MPEFDDYLRPAEARERLAVVPQAVVIDVPGAKHLFVGYTETVLDAVVGRGRPGPLTAPARLADRADYRDSSGTVGSCLDQLGEDAAERSWGG